ncbi:MAG: DUF2190 family protein [Phycisphaerae bacterium]|nr:DUF2190 family protein [Phycisphaerae bacterium]
MAQATFVHDGASIDYTPGSDVAVGEVVVLGDLVGIAPRAMPANTRGSLALTGVFDLPKAPGTGIAAGVALYWDATAKLVKTDSNSGTHKRIGNAVAAAGTTDATVRVRLNTGITDYTPLVVP